MSTAHSHARPAPDPDVLTPATASRTHNSAAYHEIAKALLAVLSDSDGVPDLKWGQEVSGLPLVAGQVIMRDCGDSPEQSQAAFNLLDAKMGRLAGKVRPPTS